MTSRLDKIDFTLSQIKDLDSNKEKLTLAIEYLKSQTTSVILNSNDYFNQERISQIFTFIEKFTSANLYTDSITIYDFFQHYEFYKVLIILNDYYSKKCDTLIPSSQITASDIINNRKTKIFYDAQVISNFLLAGSISFRKKYFELGGAKHLLNLLNNDVFVRNFHNEDSLAFVLSNVNNLAKEADSYKFEWSELNSVDTMLKLARTDENSKMRAYAVLSQTANDKQIDKLTEINGILTIFTTILDKAAIDFSSNQILKRDKIQYHDDDEPSFQQYDVYKVYPRPDSAWYLTTVMNIIYKLSINKKVKYDLYANESFRKALNIIIFKGTDIEKKFALKILAQLCFDITLLEDVRKDVELKNYIIKLSNSKDTIKSLSKLCQQLVWSFDNYSRQNEKFLISELQPKREKGHIMISYNSASRDLCLKIKFELENAGYHVWIDIDQIHGSSLESMARAVENSDLILVCVTEKYRESINCQAEAQYAFKLRKPILPLIMQNGYENVGGWLGFIIGDRIYVNFIKYSFEASIKKLINQLKLMLDTSSITNNIRTTAIVDNNSNNNSNSDISTGCAAYNWSETEVEQWFKSIENDYLFEKLKPCNGKLLHQLYQMHKNAPEYFYKFISVSDQFNHRSILVLTYNLSNIFEN